MSIVSTKELIGVSFYMYNSKITDFSCINILCFLPCKSSKNYTRPLSAAGGLDCT